MKTSSKLRHRLGFFLLGLFACALGAAAPAAANSDSRVVTGSTRIYKYLVTLDANVTYTFETSNLVPLIAGGTADTVIHVQSQNANGTFLAGNDDAVGFASRVNVTTLTTTTAEVYVRAFNDSRRSRGTFTAKRAGVVTLTDNDVVFGGTVIDVTARPLLRNTDVFTIARADGRMDHIALVVSNLTEQAVAADDDDGVALASRMRMEVACSGLCQVVVGHFGPSALPGSIGVAWDGDVNNGRDTDGDRLGNALEALIGTTANDMDKDTDNDGIDDASEFAGIDDASDPLSLPMWGASPLQKDMFVEIDWIPSCTGCPNPDGWQPTAADALEIVRVYAPDVRAHVDIGRVNPATDPTEFGKWGAWGGAYQSPWTAHCASMGTSSGGGPSPRRGVFHFHHARSGSGTGGQSQNIPAACSFGGFDGRTVAHELGHHLGLSHGGNNGSGNVNAKPNYVSIMNYPYGFDPGRAFSRKAEATVLNGENMNETTSTLSADVLNKLKDPGGAWRMNVDLVSKKIDWNRDGQFDASVRGAPTWSMGEYDGMGSIWGEQNFMPGFGPTLAWMNSPKRLYAFARSITDGKLSFRFATDFSNCSNRETNAGPCVSWSTNLRISASKGASNQAPAAHAVTVGGVEKMLVVHTDSAGLMWSILVAADNTISTPKSIESTGTDFEPTLAASGPSGKIRLYFKKSGVLQRRDYDAASDSWGAAAVEKIATSNGSIAVAFGVSVVSGFEVGRSAASFYGAVVDPNNSNTLQLFRYDATADRWTQITGIWTTGQVSKSSPSLAYVPFNTSDQTKGQFYVAFANPGHLGPDIIRIMKTEGNNPTGTVRRLAFKEPAIPLVNSWGDSVGGPRLMYKIGSDTNLRAIWKFKGFQNWFLPVADARFNLNLRDQDDYVFIRGELQCSLGKGNCLPL